MLTTDPMAPFRGAASAALRREQNRAYADQFAVLVGVDCGRTFHKPVARGRDGRRRKAIRVDVSRQGFEDAHRYLTHTFPGIRPSAMLVGIEFAGHYGATFAQFLRQQGYAIVTVLGSVTKKLREVEDNSPRKDDAKDAGQICQLVSDGLFVGHAVLSDLVSQMRVLSNERLRMGIEETRLRNRLRASLDLAFPELVLAFTTLHHKTPMAIAARWPLARDLAAASPRSVDAQLRLSSRNHIGRARTRQLVADAHASIALMDAAPARRAEIQRLIARRDFLREQMAICEAELAVLVEAHPGARALLTMPGVGVVVAAALVSEIGTPETFQSPRQVLKLAGMNLAGRSSGTSVRGRVRQTKRGRPLLRRQLFLLAGRWCKSSGLYREYYLAYVARNGGSKIKGLVAVARKLVPLVLHILQTGEPFDAARWGRQRHVA
jgi:transposase